MMISSVLMLLMMCPPPCSTFFPYTTLFRSVFSLFLSSSNLCFNLKFRTLDSHANYGALDRKSTRLNSSHVAISYAVFCLKKKKVGSDEEDVDVEDCEDERGLVRVLVDGVAR